MGPSRPVRRPFRSLVLAATLVAACVSAIPAAAAGPQCATAREAEALRVRSLQNKLMVAALTCGEAERYDAFILQYDLVLSAKGHVMSAYFSRRHGGKRVKRLMDDYVTEQANQHSLDSMRNRGAFCQEAGETLSALLDGGEETLLASATAIPDDRIAGPLVCLREARADARASGG